MNINLNDDVKIILTPYGESVLKIHNPPLFKYNYNINTKILACQLHIIMNTFGPFLYAGSRQIIKNNIIEIQESDYILNKNIKEK